MNDNASRRNNCGSTRDESWETTLFTIIVLGKEFGSATKRTKSFFILVDFFGEIFFDSARKFAPS